MRSPSYAHGTTTVPLLGETIGDKIPRYWKFVDEYPQTVTGKIQKYRMREAAVDELGLQAAAAVVSA